MNKLNLDPEQVGRARSLAARIAGCVTDFIGTKTTVAVERTVLRLFGLDGVDEDGIPLPNIVVDRVKEHSRLAEGVTKPFVNAMLQTGRTVQETGEAVAKGDLRLFDLPWLPEQNIREKGAELARAALERIRRNRERRNELIGKYGERPQPFLYVIVATGNIYEDVVQARAAARQGADIIAVIRSTGQSLLDYVPYGPTTEGFGGTFATQANFQIMRQALDDIGEELGRYIRLCNYCSGLCMPEIAAMGALERLDVMLNDALYGILFRDINMQRTLVDQNFSRMINAYAGVIINTGEDNYLTTADAVQAAHTVLASQLINEQLALRSGLKEEQMGLGHAFEMNPELEDGFLLELAQAQLAREVFPKAPLKYMPPTKHMTGNIFRGHVQDALFNMVGIMTGQGIQLLGMMSEAIHTPLIHERHLAIEAARYIFRNARHLHDEIEFKPDGIIARRARQVLADATGLLREIESIGLFESLEQGKFADVKRTVAGGKGLTGVVDRSERYYNPVEQLLREELGLGRGASV
ncbi:lysine 5,6-aminomutase subunit alpha [Effusibacillus lacus]|uniref:Dioxygenase n=1 Tax=Effusibacillus lacus TaxID=1348429 RepID=A0A292YK64_9BACL|nr:lysine 5,6-aminomutase subunit alpha [Effusibacillus lacus]TCS70490.1 beta-lysine 5,6-aminomutase alpha subunit /D-lysine 5,6-aminomutase alpha subunit [Effusibacillus lacus]GAX89556.1 dioxygenase [Effusibacillus lacus]